MKENKRMKSFHWISPSQVKQIKERRKQEYIFFPVKNKPNLSGTPKKQKLQRNWSRDCYPSPPLMYKNSTFSEWSKQVHALSISLLILHTPLTRATPLPSIVMTLKKNLIDQTNRSCLNQPRNQMKLSSFHIHLHHHEISLWNRSLQPTCKINPLNLIHIAHITRRALHRPNPPHPSSTPLHNFLTRVPSNLEEQRLVPHPCRIRQQSHPSLPPILPVKCLVGLNRVNLELLVLFGILFLKPTPYARTIIPSSNINVDIPILKANIYHWS